MLFVPCGFKSRDSNVHVQFRSFFSNLLLHFLQASAFPSATLRPWPWWEHTSVRGKLWPSAFLCLVMTSVHPSTSLLSSSSIFFSLWFCCSHLQIQSHSISRFWHRDLHPGSGGTAADSTLHLEGRSTHPGRTCV